jgi:YqaJ-like viral recombinase domain
MKVIDCVQGSEIWWDHHRGIATASSFDKIITPKKGTMSAQADDLICELIAQIATKGSIMPVGYVSPAMLNGIQMEPEARNWYEMQYDMDVKQVGICLSDDGRFGASPDALIGVGNEGCLELKCPMMKTQVRYLLDGVLPDEYKVQVHGELLVTGCKWADFVSYCPGLPTFSIRVYPDDFTKKLAECLEKFYDNFLVAKAKILG